jgi:hypothetical protein
MIDSKKCKIKWTRKMTKIDSYLGAIRPKDDLTLPYVWVSLHMSAEVHTKNCDNERFSGELKNLFQSDLFLLNTLKAIDSDRWSSLCSSAGWTSSGAMALSWCRGATLKDVGRGLASAGAVPSLGPSFQRLASLVNPAILPQPLTLKSLTAACDNEFQAFCLMLADPDRDVTWDLSLDTLQEAPAIVTPFLLARLERAEIPDRNKQILLPAWNNGAPINAGGGAGG